jgi:5,10-methylenetetrahydrofolate reductase
MSSVAASAILATNGFTPIYQMSCRDRNRIAMQGDLLGAAALGVRNVLCLTGDDVVNGDQPGAKRVFDLDSISLLQINRDMRDRRIFASGRKIAVPPNVFLGASANPFVPPHEDRVANLAAKIDAGAKFIQTQFCFDIDMFARFMEDVRARGLHHRAAIIVGVGTLNSAKALARMPSLVPGVHMPDRVVDRIGRAEDQKAAGKAFLIETMRHLATIEGVAGLHVMGFRNERLLAEAIAESGVRQMRRTSLNDLRIAI